jgi:hypothetical protein
LASEAGLAVVSLDPIGGSGEVIGDFLAKHVSQVPRVGTALASGLQSTVAWFATTPAGRRLTDVTADRLTSGYLAVFSAPAH